MNLLYRTESCFRKKKLPLRLASRKAEGRFIYTPLPGLSPDIPQALCQKLSFVVFLFWPSTVTVPPFLLRAAPPEFAVFELASPLLP